MKRCPKCSRTYPDDNQKFCTVDGGLLLSSEQAFDPNATIQIPSPSPMTPPTQQLRDVSGLPNLGETIALSHPPTGDIGKTTGPLDPQRVAQSPFSNAPTTALPSRAPSAPLPAAPAAQPQPQKKSKLPLILGILGGLLILGVGAVVAVFFLVIKPRLNESQSPPVVTRTNQTENVNQNVNTNTAEQPAAPTTEAELVPPPNSVKFTNSKENLDGKLAEHYLDFSFYYPQTWDVDPKAGVPGASNFAKVERRLPPDFTQENFAVGWYTSKGTFAADEPMFPQLVGLLGASLANGFPEYRKVSEGPTKINSLDAYEFRFESVSRGTEKGDIKLWGRVVFVPTGNTSSQTGATLIMLATSLAPELTGVEDVGVKGQMPIILDSFRFGGSR
ncbi:MAG TPA: hypothetical protein VMS31_18590 [Pyrinomonadaceae bacterium]|nr:hypothetical protein [Pyrinomonadaceae bacterium]